MSRFRVGRALRSRTLAVLLILGFVAYAIASTIISKGNWEQPYGRAPFLALLALLALSTAACAAERTKRALRLTGSFRSIGPNAQQRLLDAPGHRIPAGNASDDEVLSAAAEQLRGRGMKVSVHDGTLNAWSGFVFMWGSPIFHWALVAIVVVVGVGRLTRSEGYVGIPAGKSVTDAHANYLSVEDGILFGERHSGLRLEVSRVERHLVDNGVPYGVSPLVSVYRGEQLVARQWVHANRPLRVGFMMIHMKELGPTLVLSSEERGVGQTGLRTFLLKRDDSSSSGTAPQEATIHTMSGDEPIRARVQVVVRRQGESRNTPSRAIIETSTATDVHGPEIVVAKGSSLEISPDLTVRVVDVGDWVRLAVVNDWSVPVLYALLAIAIFALAAAIVPETRRVSLLLAHDDVENSVLHIVIWHSRRGGLFEEQVLESLRQTVSGKECE